MLDLVPASPYPRPLWERQRPSLPAALLRGIRETLKPSLRCGRRLHEWKIQNRDGYMYPWRWKAASDSRTPAWDTYRAVVMEVWQSRHVCKHCGEAEGGWRIIKGRAIHSFSAGQNCYEALDETGEYFGFQSYKSTTVANRG